MFKHDACTHPRTPAGRAACRKARATGSAGVPVVTPAPVHTPRPRRAARTVTLDATPAAFRDMVADAQRRGWEWTAVRPDKGRIVGPAAEITVVWSDTDSATFIRRNGHPVTRRVATDNPEIMALAAGDVAWPW